MLKRLVKPDHMPVNNYELAVVGLPPIIFTKVSGIEEELETADLPDRTVASGGNTKTVEFTAEQMMHHSEEVAAMERWFTQSKEPTASNYKKPATLTHFSLTGTKMRTYGLTGMFPSKRKLPDLEMNNEGEAAVIEWTFKADEVTHIA